MSVVAARVYRDKIIMAADSIVVRGWAKNTNNDVVKINRINGMIVGGVGYTQEIGLMWQYMKTHKPAAASEEDVITFMIEFSRWKRDLVGDGSINNTYLIAYDGSLFRTENMFAFKVNEYCAIGAGEDFSNAALYLGHGPTEAVKVACDLCCMVSEPIIKYVMSRQ